MSHKHQSNNQSSLIEPGENAMLTHYISLLRNEISLSPLEKFRALQAKPNSRLRRKLILHYLPQVVSYAEKNPFFMTMVAIAEVNRQLMAYLRTHEFTPKDDIDFLVENMIQSTFSNL